MKKHSISVVTALVLGLSLSASAQEPMRPAPPVPSPRAGVQPETPDRTTMAMDEAFARKCASSGHAEVELAMLAQQKGTNEHVKHLAQRIETDHKKANDELMAIADKKKLNIDPKPTAEQTKTKQRLDKLSGAEFDRAYLDTMAKDHQKNIKELERQVSTGADPELKAFASKTLPDLKEHLKMTLDAQRALTSTSQ